MRGKRKVCTSEKGVVGWLVNGEMEVGDQPIRERERVTALTVDEEVGEKQVAE